MTPADAVLKIAAAVADGAPVDWQDAEQAAASDDDRADVRELHGIEEIARLHRRLSDLTEAELSAEGAARSFRALPAPSPVGSSSAPIVEEGRWGQLVVLEKLGSGSFGDVYRAWDTTLDREVALKFLRRRSGGRTESIMREGQLLARISHPNVMAIHGAQELDGRVGIWGEFLKGRTLAALVRDDGALSADETLVVGDSICRALAAVHRAGLLHRDVKAQNVMRERGGRIVLMDFGLGRQLDEIGADQTLDIAGTPLYLAPELFIGGRASIQSDLYSLGVLMFYLATGAYPVTGTRLSEIAAAHAAARRTKLQDLRPELPTSFVQIIERAMHPDVAQRFESAGAMRAAIAAVSQTIVQRDSPPPGLTNLRWPVAAAVVLTIALTTAVTAWLTMIWQRPTLSQTTSTPRLMSFEPPPGTRFTDSARNMPAVSPDGRYVAFSAADTADGTINLWQHSLVSADARRIDGSQGALAPFWAPDSKSFGFFEPGGTIKRVTVDGVALGTVEIGQEPRGAALNGSHTLLFPRGPRSGLYALDLARPNAAERLVLAPDASRGELAFMWPQFLRDGDRFIYFVLSNDPDVRGLYLASLRGGPGRRLASTDASGIVANDRLLYVKANDLVSQPFDKSSGTVKGGPTPVIANVAVAFDWRSIVSAADDGTLVYLPAQEDTELVWFDRSGAQRGRIAVPPARYRSPSLSQDGRFVAVQRYRDGLSEIQVFDVETGQARPSLAHSADVQFPVWGPGHQLAYASGDTGRMDLYIKDFNRDDPPQRLDLGESDPEDGDKMPTDWSRDGKHLVVVDRGIDRRYNVWVVPVENPRASRPLRSGEGSQYGGRLSPDGRSAIYVRRVRPFRDGAPPERELWACDFPSGQHPRLITTGGIDPSWPSNESVSFLDRAGRLTLLRAGRPSGRSESLGAFPTGVDTPEGSRNSYAWSADGERILVNRPVEPGNLRRVMMLLAGS